MNTGSNNNHIGKAFYDLKIWQKSRELRNQVFTIIPGLPAHEKFGLSDQVKRSSRSVAACIAEGYGRFTFKDQIHFCIMARGSLSELLNHIIDAYDQKYIDKKILKEYQLKIEELLKMLNGSINYLRKSISVSR